MEELKQLYGYIYLITCEVNLKVYIGQHKYDKPELDPDYFCSSKNPEFWNDVKEYGIENFTKSIEILCYSKKELQYYETFYIRYYRKKYGRDQVYNLTEGGDCGWSYINENHEEFIEKSLNTNRENHGGVLAWNTDDAHDKSVATRSSMYNGDCMGACHTEESIVKRLETQRSHGTLDEHMRLMRKIAASPESRAKAMLLNNIDYIYFTGDKYLIGKRTLAHWKKKGYARLCKLSDWPQYCLDHNLDPDLINN